MTVLRPYHWVAAILAAVALHLLVFISLDTLPGFPPQAVRGGGLDDQGGDDPDGGAGLLVSLGKAPRAAGSNTENLGKTDETPAAPAAVSARSGAQSAAAEPRPDKAAEQAPEPDDLPPVEGKQPAETEKATAPEQTPDLPEDRAAKTLDAAEPVETRIKTPPLPSRKPKAPEIRPDFEPFGRRLSAQGPEPVPAPAGGPASGSAEPAGAQTASEGGQETLAFAANGKGAGRIGDASGRELGSAPELNYEDRVLLWLKRNGNYPREAYRFRQEGVVMLRFIVLRSGEIRHYNLVKSSGYYLLDEAVHKMMKRANPVPPIPPEVGKAELEFTIPVRFSRDYAEQTRPAS